MAGDKIMDNDLFRIGFANLTKTSAYAMDVQQSLIDAVNQRSDIELICLDNDLDDQIALENAYKFSSQQLDYVIFFHINERLGMEIQSILKNIPILTIDIPFPSTIHFGINNRQAGVILGESLSDWIISNWNGQIDKILALVDYRVLDTLRDRTTYAVEAFKKQLTIQQDIVLYLDSGNNQTTTINNASQVFNRWSDNQRIVVFGFNADSTYGILEAAKQTGILENIAIAGHAADKYILEEIQKDNSHIISVSYYDPRNYGEQIMQIIDKARLGKKIPRWNLVDMEIYSAPNPFHP